MDASPSLFERFIARPRRPLAMLGIVILLFAAPFVAAYADGLLNDLIRVGAWRGLLVPPAVITYIFVIAPPVQGMESAVLRSIRPAVLVDDEQFNRLVQRTVRTSPRQESAVFVAGALLGLLMATFNSSFGWSWVAIVGLLSIAVMYGLLAWAVYGSVLGGRLTAALLRQPLRIDPFDTTPFEPTGRQSLLLALVFVGGITLSLPFVVLQPGALLQPQFWLIYISLAAIPVVVFFVGMTPVHRVLAAARDHEREVVEEHLLRLCRDMMQRLEGNQETGSLPMEINALTAYDERLQSAPTWPYNTGMLRTLIFSFVIPAATILGKIAVDLFLD